MTSELAGHGKDTTRIQLPLPLIPVTETKTRGGQRPNSGRPRSTDPTIVIRVPGSKVRSCQELCKYGFTSDQVFDAYLIHQRREHHITIPGAAVPAQTLYRVGFDWLDNYNHFATALQAMALTRADMTIESTITLLVSFQW